MPTPTHHPAHDPDHDETSNDSKIGPTEFAAVYALDTTTKFRSWCDLCIVAGVNDEGELCKACAYGVLIGRVDPTTGLTIPSRFWPENRR